MIEDRLKSATFFLLFSIVSCDCVLLSFYVATGIIQITFRLQGAMKTYALGQMLQYLYIGVMLRIVTTCKVYITIAVSFQRYLSVCHPFKSKQWGTVKLAQKQLLGALFMAILLWGPTFFEYKLAFAPNGFAMRKPWSYTPAGFLVRSICQTTLEYVVPISGLVIMSVMLLRGLRIAQAKKTALKGHTEEKKSKQSFQISLMINVLMWMVIISQLLVPIRQIILIYQPQKFGSCDVFYYFDPWIGIAQVSTASIGFIMCLSSVHHCQVPQETGATLQKTRQRRCT
jgi:hypothetical protein